MTDTKREEIKQKVADGEARVRARQQSLQERAAEVRDNAVQFARENPVLVVVGALALGAAVSLLFQRPRQASTRVAKQATKKASGLAILIAEFAAPLLQQAFASATEAGRAGLDRAEELGGEALDRARVLGRTGADRASETFEAAQDVTRDASRKIVEAVRSKTN